MINTNGNRRPKTFEKFVNITENEAKEIRSVLNGNFQMQKHSRFKVALEKIFLEASKKAGHIFLTFSKNKEFFNVNVYVFEKKAVASYQHRIGTKSDEVTLNKDYIFSDVEVNNSPAKMYFENGAIVVIQSKAELKKFEESTPTAIYLGEVEVLDSNKNEVSIKVKDSKTFSYRSSASYALNEKKKKEKLFYHLKKGTRGNVSFDMFEMQKDGSFTPVRYSFEEDISSLKDGFYKVVVNSVEKVIIVQYNAITSKNDFYIVPTDASQVKDKEIKSRVE